MSYRRFKLPELTVAPATLATLATLRTEAPQSVASVASVAGPISESAYWPYGREDHTEHIRRESGHDWSAEDWQVFFDERAAIIEFDGGLPREEAEVRAFACCVVEWLNRHPCRSTPRRCAHCGGWESLGAVVLPFGIEPGRHVWLHAECWPTWHQARQAEAIAALATMGIREPRYFDEQTDIAGI